MFDKNTQTLKIYIYNNEGFHTPGIVIRNSYNQLASCIKHTENAPKIVVTDRNDNLLLNTVFGFIDKCTDKKYLEKFLDVLIPMQKGKEDPSKLEVIDWGASQENNSSEIMIPFIKEKFNIDFKDKVL